jgi:hypothetical protein
MHSSHTASPISGNQHFSSVSALAAPLSNLSVSNLSVSKMSAGSVKQTERGTETTVVGYTPEGWGAGLAGATTSLVVSENGRPASSTSLENLLLLPSGAIVTRVKVVKSSTTLLNTGLYAVGLADLGTAGNVPNGTIQTLLMDDTAQTDINGVEGVVVGGRTIAAAPALGAAGVAASTLEAAGVVVANNRNSVIVRNSAADPTGSLRVSITYVTN